MKSWLLLIYKIPREPAAGRVHVWRKLKQVGALLLHDAAWVLPLTEKTREQFQWLAAEITDLGGQAYVWECDQIYATDPAELQRAFVEPIEAQYRELQTLLEQPNPDLKELSRKFRDIAARDYFSIPVGQQVRQQLLAAQEHRPL